jgi:hypothetical protein
MSASTSYHQLGLFLVLFQHIEGTVNEIIGHLVPAQDSEAVRILISALGYNQRLKVADALLRRTVEIHSKAPTSLTVGEFSALMKKLELLGGRRNSLVHSRYYEWIATDGDRGMLRQNTRMQKGALVDDEEELLPSTFDAELSELRVALGQLDAVRLQVIDLAYAVLPES